TANASNASLNTHRRRATLQGGEGRHALDVGRRKDSRHYILLNQVGQRSAVSHEGSKLAGWKRVERRVRRRESGERSTSAQRPDEPGFRYAARKHRQPLTILDNRYQVATGVGYVRQKRITRCRAVAAVCVAR